MDLDKKYRYFFAFSSRFLMADDREVLQDAGKIKAGVAKGKDEAEFEK